MVRAGHPMKQAVAASLASKRKYKKMYKGGEVYSDIDDDAGVNETQHDIQAMGESRPNKVMNPDRQMDDRMLAEALMNQHEDGDEAEGYAMGGLVQPEEDEMNGNEPSEAMESEVGEPMSELDGTPAELDHSVVDGYGIVPGISGEAQAELMKRKKMRRFGKSYG